MKVRIVLADDHLMMREGLRSILHNKPEIEIVGEADTGRRAVELAAKTGADVVVMDVVMPGLNGIEATRLILTANPKARVVALSAHTNRVFVREMLKVGASAYVLKSRASEELLQAIHEAMEGKKHLSPDIASGVVNDYLKRTSHGKEHAYILLTDREREVLQLLAEGKTTKETASDMGVSVKTVETHRRNLMEKLNLHNVAHLTKYAIREGITTLDE